MRRAPHGKTLVLAQDRRVLLFNTSARLHDRGLAGRVAIDRRRFTTTWAGGDGTDWRASASKALAGWRMYQRIDATAMPGLSLEDLVPGLQRRATEAFFAGTAAGAPAPVTDTLLVLNAALRDRRLTRPGADSSRLNDAYERLAAALQ